jgi:hypothetical protein
MTTKYFFASLTRISNLPEVLFSVQQLSQEEWETGDYVVGEVDTPPSDLSRIELNNGRNVEVIKGDLVVGAFGKRHATLAAVGECQNIGDDLQMETLTGAGLFGKASSETKRHLSFTYEGHVFVDGEKAAMRDFAPRARRGAPGRGCRAYPSGSGDDREAARLRASGTGGGRGLGGSFVTRPRNPGTRQRRCTAARGI